MAEFKPIETQEALDAIIKERIARVESKYSDYAELKAYKDAHKGKDVAALESQIETLTGKVQSLTDHLTEQTAKARESGLALMRIEVAREAGVRPELADRLRGETREDMEKDAKVLAGLQTADKTQPGYKAKTDNPSGDAKSAAYKTMLSGLVGES